MTHINNGGSGAGVLGPGFWGTRRLARLADGYSKPPAPERPVVYVCINYRTCPRFIFYWRNVAPLYYGQRKKRNNSTKQTEDKSIRRFKRKRNANGIFFWAKQRNKKNTRTWTSLWFYEKHECLSIFFYQMTTTGTLKHRVEILLEAN